uniref:Uncharacterized protein n=1 Tax=Mimivirus LCMiAC02 TaxID=2506609 RepID=A0A4D5XF24_9VIRU|nr:MAG: hypothetical protein LCMiAC02_04440 [Mimivirus LCMiAC02]
MVNKNYFKLLAVIIFIVSIKLYIDQKNVNYRGPRKRFMLFKNISFLKHDITKIAFVSIFTLLVYGTNGEKFFDLNNIIHSQVGKILVVMIGYFVYHVMIQPYIVSKMPNW